MSRKSSIFILLFVAFIAVECVNQNVPSMPKYEQWKKQFGLQYEGSVDQFRRGVFQATVKRIVARNSAPNRQITLRPNAFAALTADEFALTYLNLQPPNLAVEPPPLATQEVPENDDNEGGNRGNGRNLQEQVVDWVARGKVTAVRNQGSCGSCWAFASVGAIESAFLMKGIASDLSEQQLVDCTYTSSGCNGGWMDTAYSYIIKARGISTEASYPYTKIYGSCKPSASKFTIQTWENSLGSNCDDLKRIVRKGPVSAAVGVGGDDWSSYYSGIISTCSTGVNHAILVTGFNSTTWTFKNSWGTRWSADGYGQLKMGNTCFICKYGGQLVTAGTPAV